ncbi:hypothetical protein ACVMIH_001788 [Bradyrhizobium sp. USDA 4503]
MVPTEVVAALSVLNGHARAHGCGRDAIYHYKGLVAMIYAAAGQADARPVGVSVKCHNCFGTGKFFCQYNGQTDEPCRTCTRTGYVFLRFTETTIDGHGWHHPWITEGEAIYRKASGATATQYDPATRSLWVTKADQPPENFPIGFVGDWKPNVAGEKFVGERAAELLNLVEGWVTSTSLHVEPDLKWRLERAQQAARGYSLALGWLGDCCHYCGETKTVVGQGHYKKPFQWTIRCCEEHAGSKMPVATWDSRLPSTALTPAILKWAERRGWSAEQSGAAT